MNHFIKGVGTTFCILLCFGGTALAASVLKLGEIPPKVVIADQDGGKTTGQPWSSEEIKGKMWLLFYVDPDERDLNPHVEKAIEEANFPKEKIASIGMINMEATWLPNAVIATLLKQKQEKYPETVYVKDLTKKMVKTWGLVDDSYNSLLFASDGKLLFQKSGKLSDQELNDLLALIRKNL